jgi:outer membrane protein
MRANQRATNALLLAAATLLAGAETTAQARLAKLTLHDAVELALRRHPATRVVSELTEAARTRVGQAEAGYLPRVYFAAQWLGGTINGNPVSFINLPDTPRIAGSKPNRNASDYALWSNYLTGFSTGVPIYDFGRTRGRVDEAVSGVRESESTERVVRERIIHAVRRAYYAALVAEGALRIAQESVARVKQHLREVQLKIKQGLRAEVEVYRPQADLARAKVRVVAAQNDLEVARLQLDNAIGERTSGRFDLVPDTSTGRLDASPDRLLSVALRVRPEIGELNYRRESLRGRLDSTRGNYYPALAASAAVNVRGTGGVGNFLNFDMGLMLAWPIFEGNLFKKQEQETYARMRSLGAAYEELRQRIDLEVRSAFAQAKSAEDFIRAAREAFLFAQKNLLVAQERFRTGGQGTMLEIADAEELYVQSELGVVRAGYEFRAALANLERAVGQRVPLAP